MSGATQYIGSKISLISKSDIRYEGILYTIDPVDCTIALAKVKSMGTEDRPTDRPVSARNEVYEYIVFRGSDIRDIRVCQPPKPQPVLAGGLPNDPAILQHSVPGTSTQTNEPGSTAAENGLGSLMSGMRVKNDAPVDLTTSGSSVSAQPPGLSLLPLPNFPPSAAPRSTQHDKTDTNTSTTQPGSPVNRHRNANNQNNSPQRRQNRQQQSNSTSGRYQNDFHFPQHQHQQNGYQNRGFQNYRDNRGFEPRGFDSYHLDRRPFNFDQGFNQGRSNMGFRGGRVDFPNRNRGFDNRRGFEDRRMSGGFGGNFGGRQNFDYGYNNFGGGGMRFGGNQYGQNFGGGGGGGGMNAGNQQRRNSSRQWFAGVGGGGGNGNVGGTGIDNRRDSESGGGGGGGGQRKLTFSEEFDFESANTEFEHLMEKFSEVKIDNTESAAAESAGDKKASEEEKDGDKKDQSDSKSDDENVGKETVKKTYDPTISFFDNLSNAPPKTNNMDRNRLVKLNLETFGERGRSRPGRRQSINNIPGAQNYRFRGDFLYANNYRAYGNNFNNRFRGFNNRMIEGRMDFRDRFGNGGMYLRNPRY